MPYMIVSYFTTPGPYEQVSVDYLGKSLIALNLPHTFYAVPSEGTWNKNVALKPKIILRAMEEFPNHNIVFIDADATVEKLPILFDEIPIEYDIALHYLDWATWYNRPGETKKELLSGTVFLRNNDKVRGLVKKWYIDSVNSGTWEQKILQLLLERNKGEVSVFPLPINYIWINTLPDGKEPWLQCNDKVVVHYQLSRLYKRTVNN